MLSDLRLALRSLLKTPAFALATVVILALGIGANTAIFSIVFGVLAKPLPFAEPARLVSVIEVDRALDRPSRSVVSSNTFREWQAAARSLEQLAIYTDARYTVTGHGEPEYVETSLVSEGFFTTLGTRPVTGRVLGKADAGQPVAVLAWEFKQRRFGTGDAIGRTLLVDGKAHTVVGVMPPAFRYPSVETMAWLPRLSMGNESKAAAEARVVFYKMIGRIRKGATIEQARAEAAVIGRTIDAARGVGKTVETQLRSLEDEIVGDVRKGLLVLFAVVGFVLLVACINVAGLCLARSASRRSDAAVRAALGASRWQLVRHLLAESVLLAAGGAVAGAWLAAALLPLIVRLIAPHTPRLAEVTIGFPVLAFTMAATALTVLLAGLLPAWHASRLSPSEVLSANAGAARQTPRTGRLRFALVTAETALSTVVLIAALLFARSLGMLLAVESDRPIDHVLTLGLTLPAPGYGDLFGDAAGSARANAFADNVLDRVRRIRGVHSAALTTSLPPNVAEMSFTLPQRNRATGKNEAYTFNIVVVGGDYFRVMGIAQLRGRLFNESDRAGSPPVIIVNRDFARRRFGGEDVVGKHQLIGPGAAATIVGVVDDVRYQGLDRDAGGALYLPYAQAAYSTYYLAVRTAGSPRAVADAVRDTVRAADPQVPMGQPRTLDEIRHASVTAPESRAVLLAGLAALALVLAAAGLYGNSSYATSQRTFEVGVRMALGADGRSVIRLLVGRGLAPVALGLVIGLTGGAAVSRVVQSLLFEVHPIDPVTFAGVPLVLLIVAAASITVPALRATRLDPAQTLRRQA